MNSITTTTEWFFRIKLVFNLLPVIGTFALVLLLVMARFDSLFPTAGQDLKTGSAGDYESLRVLTILPDEIGDPMTPYGVMSLYLHQELQNDTPNKIKVYRAPTVGSLDTLIQVERSNEPCIGLVQADVLYHYLHGGHPQFPLPRTQSRVRAISHLFDDWLLCFEHTPLTSQPQDVSDTTGSGRATANPARSIP